MIIKIINNNKGYNGACDNCGRIQPRSENQPYIVYFKRENGRGRNYIACCTECADALKALLER